jgi:hypothetical protein
VARKRMIDPSIWTDEGMAALTPRQQLLYIGLVSNADDAGRLRGSAIAVRLMLPTVFGEATVEEIEAELVAVLGQMRKLCRYQHDGNTYLAFRNYSRWQNINRPTPSKMPHPPEECVSPPAGTTPDATPLTDDSVSAHAQVKGREGEGKGREKSDNGRASAPPRAIRDPLKPRKPEECATHEPAMFARLWGYWGKVGDVGDAGKAWDALRPSRDLMQAMRAAIDRQREAFGWGQPGGQAQPHLATWIRKERWHMEAIPNKVEAS